MNADPVVRFLDHLAGPSSTKEGFWTTAPEDKLTTARLNRS
jgi:hypothetical protein